MKVNPSLFDVVDIVVLVFNLCVRRLYVRSPKHFSGHAMKVHGNNFPPASRITLIAV